MESESELTNYSYITGSRDTQVGIFRLKEGHVGIGFGRCRGS